MLKAPSVQGQRARTKQLTADGKESLALWAYACRARSDWPQSAYNLFTDACTWQGFDRLARAYELAQLPEAVWLRQEADDYRKCILGATRRSLKPHPFDAALKWVPSDIYEEPAKVQATAIFEGPQARSAPKWSRPTIRSSG